MSPGFGESEAVCACKLVDAMKPRTAKKPPVSLQKFLFAYFHFEN